MLVTFEQKTKINNVISDFVGSYFKEYDKANSKQILDHAISESIINFDAVNRDYRISNTNVYDLSDLIGFARYNSERKVLIDYLQSEEVKEFYILH